MSKPADPIPDDIWRDAYDICNRFEPSTEAVAHAIFEERERCASIAREHVFDGHALAQATEFGRGCHQTATEIASAIRNEGGQKT